MTLSISKFLILKFLFTYFKWKAETEIFHLLVHSPNAFNSQGWARPGDWNSIWFSYVGCPDSSTQAITCCLQGREVESEARIWTDPLIRDCVPGGILPAVLNAHPQGLLLTICIQSHTECSDSSMMRLYSFLSSLAHASMLNPHPN